MKSIDHHDDLAASARNFYCAVRGAERSFAPVHAYPHTAFVSNQILILAQLNPRSASRSRVTKGRTPAIKNIEVPALLVEGDKRRESCLASRARPNKLRTFNSHAKLRRGWNLDLGELGHGVHRRLVPIGVPNVCLIHHMAPFAVRQSVVVIRREVRVGLKQGARLRGQIVRAGAALAGVKMVSAGGDVQLRDDRGRFCGIENKLEESIALILWQLVV